MRIDILKNKKQIKKCTSTLEYVRISALIENRKIEARLKVLEKTCSGNDLILIPYWRIATSHSRKYLFSVLNYRAMVTASLLSFTEHVQ